MYRNVYSWINYMNLTHHRFRENEASFVHNKLENMKWTTVNAEVWVGGNSLIHSSTLTRCSVMCDTGSSSHGYGSHRGAHLRAALICVITLHLCMPEVTYDSSRQIFRESKAAFQTAVLKVSQPTYSDCRMGHPVLPPAGLHHYWGDSCWQENSSNHWWILKMTHICTYIEVQENPHADIDISFHTHTLLLNLPLSRLLRTSMSAIVLLRWTGGAVQRVGADTCHCRDCH